MSTQDPLFPSAEPGGHDRELSAVRTWFLGQPQWRERFAAAVRNAFDDAINPFGTCRTCVSDLTKPEKTMIGMMVERRIREEFDLPKGKTLDYVVARAEVDCKFSTRRCGWMVPPEAVGRLCLLVYADESTRQLDVGLVRMAPNLLRPGKNQDNKVSLSVQGRGAIQWLVKGRFLPENRLLTLGREERDAVLGRTDGARRARELFIRCEGLIINPSEVSASLEAAGYAFLSGDVAADRERAHSLGGPVPQPGEWLCLRLPNQDGSSSDETGEQGTLPAAL